MSRRISLVLLSVGMLAGLAPAQVQEGLRTCSVGGGTTEIEFRPIYWTDSIRTDNGSFLARFRFVGETGLQGAQEGVEQSYAEVNVEVPSGDASLTVLAAEFHDVDGLHVAPVPRYTRDGAFGAITTYPHRVEGGNGETSPEAPARLLGVHRAGRRYIAAVRLSPLRYLPAKNVTRVYDRLALRVAPKAAARVLPERALQLASPLSSGEWYRMEVRDDGIYRIDRALLAGAGLPVETLDIHSIRIFGNGGRMLPEPITAARPAGLQEVARLVVDQNGNGLFDADDYILFCGASPRGWQYNASTQTFSHFINYYSEVNVYFLTYGGSAGKDMTVVPSEQGTAVATPQDCQGMAFLEQDRFNLINSGRQWFGQQFDPETPSAVFVTSLPGLDTSQSITYRFVVATRSEQNESFRFEEQGNLLGRVLTSRVNTVSIQDYFAFVSAPVSFTRSGNLTDSRSQVRVTYEMGTSSSKGWLDWFEILYRRRLEASGDMLAFPSADLSGLVRYTLSGFSSRSVNVFDVTDHNNVREISNVEFDPVVNGKLTFQYPDTSGSVRWLLAVGPDGLKAPASLKKIGNSDLTGITQGAAFIIVTPAAFQEQAERLKEYREQHDSLSTIVAPIEDIWNEYSGGLVDPTALRDFLRDAYVRWVQPPRYVLLFGDGHFDYRAIASSLPNWIPPYETLESSHYINSYTTDDFFVQLDPGNPRVSLALGRIPAATLAEATAAVDRIIHYETSSPFDSWRDRILYVADDGLTSTGNDYDLHTRQAETLAEVYTPSWIDKRKIFIVEYPTVNSASGRRKPSANRAIIDAINRGALMVNYTGHGNPEVWAHEAVFTREESLPQLTNADRLGFFVTATCDFTRFDNPSEESAGEMLMFLASGGAIGVVSASRAVYSDLNALFNNTFYSMLLVRDSTGHLPRLGDAMHDTKQLRYGTNDVKYFLFGDPTLRLAAPGGTVVVDSINGAPSTGTVPLLALGRTDFVGAVHQPSGNAWSSFNGRALVEMYDAKRKVPVPEWGSFTFVVNGGLLYRGEVSVNNGVYDAAIPIPKDVSYDSSAARLAVYAWSSNADAVGYTENVVIAGTDSSAVPDTVGPQIDVFLQDENFRSGDVVPPNVNLIVKVRDQSGINTSSAGIGHRLEARLSSESESRDLTEYYRGDLDTYQSGEADYPLQNLSDGQYAVRVKAWDIYNNPAEAEAFFEVRSGSGLQLYNVVNIPNPFRTKTMFTFQRAGTEPVDVAVKIYTVAGRLIQTIDAGSTTDRFVQVSWDGRDRDGNRVANGVYFYKIVVRSSSEGKQEEALGKVAIVR